MKRVPAFMLLLFLLISCGNTQEVTDNAGYRIACINEEGTALEYRSIYSGASDNAQLVQLILDELALQPEDNALEPVLKEGAGVESFSLEGEQLILQMEPGYRELPAATEILCRAALVQCLTQLPGVEGVSFQVKGEAFVDAAGNAVGMLNSESFIMAGGEASENAGSLQLTLYFANDSGDKLIACRRSVPYDGSTEQERLVVEQLIAGPYEPGLYPSIPSDTHILSISVSDGICYVNLDSGFLEGGGALTPQVSIYSIVNSLAELGNVRRVRFLINGESNVTYREVMDLEESYIRNLEIVE